MWWFHGSVGWPAINSVIAQFAPLHTLIFHSLSVLNLLESETFQSLLLFCLHLHAVPKGPLASRDSAK